MSAGARGPEEPVDSPKDRRLDEFAYGLLLQQSLGKDAQVWQTPALAVTAQAFLLTVALAGDTSRTSRCIVAVLGVVLAYVTCQVMARHRYLRRLVEWQLRQLERDLGLPNVSWFGFGEEAKQFAGRTWLNSGNSYLTWQAGSVLVGLAHLLVLVLVIAWPEALTGH